MQITIDHIRVEVTEGMTIMQAAASHGISIPALCYREGHANHPSCMICLVKDLGRDRLLTSCSFPVEEGMNILTHSHEIHEARKEALELLLSDHAGDCEAPCRRSCPAFMDIPNMNRLIAAGRWDEALSLVREEIALPLILSYICTAPCEKACHRASIDGAVSICLLKRETARDSSRRNSGLLLPVDRSGKKIAIVGTGPAGLSAAFYLLRLGHECTLFDRHDMPGGMLRYHIPEDKLPQAILEAEIDCIRQMGASFALNTAVTRELFDDILLREFNAIILATGGEEKMMAEEFGLELDEHGIKVSRTTYETLHPGIFACGNMIRKRQMAVRSVAQGKAAALSADHFLRTGKPKGVKHKFNSAFGRLRESEFGEYLKESFAHERIEPAKGFDGGYSAEEAMLEAKRCLNCDCRKPVSCKLRIYASEYQAHQKHYAGPDRKQITRSMHHDQVVYEPEKCIKCGLCVEITQKEKEHLGLTFIGRGFDVRVGVPFGETVRDALMKTGEAVVEACPTGALALKKGYERS